MSDGFKFVTVEGTPDQVADQLTEMREDMARTFDGVPIWTAPAMDAEGRIVIMVLTLEET